MDPRLAQFAGKRYLNLESYRKSGAAVRTPLWFAQDEIEGEGVLYIYSVADAGKVKRIRNDARVRVVPCTLRGAPRGEWVEGRAQILDAAGAAHGHHLLRRKYLLKRVGDFFGRLRRRQHAVMAIGCRPGVSPALLFPSHPSWFSFFLEAAAPNLLVFRRFRDRTETHSGEPAHGFQADCNDDRGGDRRDAVRAHPVFLRQEARPAHPLGIVGLVCCIVGGLIAGIILALPTAGVFALIIAVRPNPQASGPPPGIPPGTPPGPGPIG